RRVVIDQGAQRPNAREQRQARQDAAQSRAPKAPIAPPTGPVSVESGVTIQELSQALGVKVQDIMKFLMGLNVMKPQTASLTDGEDELRAAEVEREMRIKHAGEGEEGPGAFDDTGESLRARPPVVTIMSRRPRQDDAPRRDPRRPGRRNRGRRYHTAHRRVSG